MNTIITMAICLAGFFIILPIVLFIQLFNRTNNLREEIYSLRDKIRELDSYKKDSQISASIIPVTSPSIKTEAAKEIEPTVKQEFEMEKIPQPAPVQPAISVDTSSPSFFEKYLAQYFTGGRALVSTGIIIIFFGIAFLLKYVSGQISVPIELRFIGIAISAVIMMVTGWRFVEKRRIFGLALQGGGIGILFLTTFAAFRVYNLIDPGVAFGLLAFLGACSAFLALKNDSKELAVLATIGGFLAPILASTGSGSHVGLFGYYLMLNIIIVVIAWFKTWRLLNLIGFGFTFVISALWGFKYYSPDYFASTEPFLIIFFLLYVLVAILFATRQPPNLKGYIDGTIVFGVPLVGFGLQTALMRTFEHGSAISAVTLGAFYSLLWYVLYPQTNRGLQVISKAFLALGLIFLTLAIPLAFDGRHTSGLWALEGAAIIWINMRQKNLFCRLFGTMLQFGAGIFLFADHHYQGQGVPVFNSYYIGCVIISLSALFSAYLYNHYNEVVHRIEKNNSTILALWGMLWWFSSGIVEIRDFVAYQFEPMSGLGFIAGSVLLMEIIGNKYHAEFLRKPILFLLPIMVFVALSQLDNTHPFMNGGILAWPAAFIAQYFMLYARDNEKLRWYHVGSLWLLLILLAKEISYFISSNIGSSDSLVHLPWFIIPALVIGFISRKNEILPWPFNNHSQTYIGLGIIPIMCFMAILFIYSALHLDGTTYPIPYIPLFNLLDMAHLIVILSALAYIMHVRKYPPEWLNHNNLQRLIGYPALFSFLWINAALLRAIHHITGIAYSYTPLFNSALVQASITILWTLTATGVMIFASRKYMRVIWFVGASLLGVVVIKLFIIDLSGTGTLARIVSFMGVGGLTLLLGYFSPVPPENKDTNYAAKTSI